MVATPVIDTYIRERDGNDDTNRSVEPRLILRVSKDGRITPLLKFSLDDLPRDAEILGAELRLQVISPIPPLESKKYEISVFRAEKRWCANADWVRYCDDDRWCKRGASGTEDDCRPPLSADVSFDYTSLEMDLNTGVVKSRDLYTKLAEWVHGWHAGEIENNGLLLKFTSFVEDTQLSFAASEYVGQPVDSAPVLTVYYRIPPGGRIEGSVWHDQNGNSRAEQEEPGVAGVQVELYVASNPTAPLTTTQTLTNGRFSFGSLRTGLYYLKYSLPTDYRFSPQGADSRPDPADGRTEEFQLPPGAVSDNWNAGMYKPASVGGEVWEDVNRNGKRDDADRLVSFPMSVTLYVYVSDTGSEMGRATTVNGVYSFADLAPGAYQIAFQIPIGWSYTPQGSDSTPDPVSGRTAPVIVSSGANNQTMHAGIYERVSEGPVCLPLLFDTHSNDPCFDPHEPNNTWQLARMREALPRSKELFGVVAKDSDHEYYWLGVIEQNRTIVFRLWDIPTQRDYDLYLIECKDAHDPPCQLVCDSTRPGNEPEELDCTITETGDYYVWLGPRPFLSGSCLRHRFSFSVR